ncbi:hypothetical protein SAMN05216428_103140 [Nitrosospira sp. Nsp11]|uniref:hypothetical protein n=1 Tax=Nitrosospira sp. Nsp11 TaxID=1855338 RepID=UPI00090FE5BC|nr:hypothetical protein [Nitrosospira sp. Nsp11]SHL54008.1 hypothetical protein SAMN05216428_103140 [Nitrosospira sp. Nsp11]
MSDTSKKIGEQQHYRACAANVISSADCASIKSAPRSPNYFLRHWRRNLSLPVSYWINAIILVGVLTIILFAAVAAIVNSNIRRFTGCIRATYRADRATGYVVSNT